jgi:hypothetical protein
MENLDLDIHNYTIADIEKFFQFKPKSKYTAEDIELHEYRIREQLLNSGHINKRFKKDLIAFLEVAKEWLTLVKCPPPKSPSLIPKNYKLDTLDTPLSKEPPPREDELVRRPSPDFTYTQKKDTHDNKYFPGKLNPMNTRTTAQCITIDTRFRDSYFSTSSTDFMIQMPKKFHKVVSMQLSSFEIPIAFYNICAAHNNHFFSFVVKYISAVEDDEDEPSAYEEIYFKKIVIIPDGHYTATSLISTLNLYFTTSEPILASFNWCYDNQSSKVAVFTDNKNVLSFSMDFTQNLEGIPVIYGKPDLQPLLIDRFGWILGFTSPQYTGKFEYVGESIVNVLLNRYIYLAVDDFQNNVTNPFVGFFQESLLNQNILARISVRGEPFQLIKEHDYSCVLEPRRYFGPVDIQRIRIRLLDEKGRPLIMNHADYSFCLTLNLLYDL